jgi:hypothetical protein
MRTISVGAVGVGGRYPPQLGVRYQFYPQIVRMRHVDMAWVCMRVRKCIFSVL